MKIISKLLVIVFLVGIGCKNSNNIKDISWVEVQTLCVYWVHTYEGRDTLPAINFIIKAKRLDNVKDTNVVFTYNEHTYKLKKTNIVDKNNYKLLGLKLISSDLWDKYDEDRIIGDGSCYRDSLNSMVKKGQIAVKGSETVIKKSSDFKLQKGLKEIDDNNDK